MCCCLAALGAYRLVLLASLPRARRRALATAPPPPPSACPIVTVQLPIFDERYVVRRLLEAVARLDWPRDRLEIQVLDDSEDRTAVLARRIVRRLRARGLDVHHVRRGHRTGYKAGALAHGLRSARGELIAIFDADFVPPPDFLRRTVPHLLAPGAGCVQARWTHLNRDASPFTRMQSVLLDGHFAIDQPVRSWSGHLLGFNGTAGVWRRTAIESAGGWRSDTLTEDLDLSLRAQLGGWRIVYRDDIVVPAELPLDPNALRAQQRRWTKGGVQVARKLLPAILRSRLPRRVRVEAALHLVSYAAYPLLVGLALLHAPVRAAGPGGILPWEALLLGFGTLPLVAYYVVAQARAGAPGGFVKHGFWALAAMALGAGLAVGNTRAVVEGLVSRDLRFERTPKLGGARRLLRAAPYRSRAAGTTALEIGLLAYLVTWRLVAPPTKPFGEVPLLTFFALGLCLMVWPTLRGAGRPAGAT